VVSASVSSAVHHEKLRGSAELARFRAECEEKHSAALELVRGELKHARGNSDQALARMEKKHNAELEIVRGELKLTKRDRDRALTRIEGMGRENEVLKQKLVSARSKLPTARMLKHAETPNQLRRGAELVRTFLKENYLTPEDGERVLQHCAATIGKRGGVGKTKWSATRHNSTIVAFLEEKYGKEWGVALQGCLERQTMDFLDTIVPEKFILYVLIEFRDAITNFWSGARTLRFQSQLHISRRNMQVGNQMLRGDYDPVKAVWKRVEFRGVQFPALAGRRERDALVGHICVKAGFVHNVEAGLDFAAVNVESALQQHFVRHDAQGLMDPHIALGKGCWLVGAVDAVGTMRGVTTTQI
jgi:hypothetical protein